MLAEPLPARLRADPYPGLATDRGGVIGRPAVARHNAPAMRRLRVSLAAGLVGLALAGCATRSADVAPSAADPAEFLPWDCDRIDDELGAVQQRAAEMAYAVDQRAGNNIVALGLGVTVFWPAILAMRPDGLEAQDLARLKGRDEALRDAARQKSCPPPSEALSATRAARIPLALGERLVYEDRHPPSAAPHPWVLHVTALRRSELDFLLDGADAEGGGVLRQDLAGNIVAAPPGALVWPHLLRHALDLGAVVGGEMLVVGDPLERARVRGQVVAVGPQTVAGRRFDVAVIELFGDAQRGEAFTRVEGAIAVDRLSGVLLRLDLRSAQDSFSMQRRLVRVEPATR